MKPTTVVNIKREGRGFDIYIGRRVVRAHDERCHVESCWRNPYRVGVDATSSEECLELFELHIRGWINELPTVRQRALRLLEGKRLGCWCAPDPCHGQVLIRLLDELKDTGRVAPPEKPAPKPGKLRRVTSEKLGRAYT